MDTQTLSPDALSVIDHYLHFHVGPAVCSIPYFNNKTVRARGALGISVGKGSPKEITDEVNMLIFKHHIDSNALTDDSLKKFLVDRNIGIDCSGFAYHILNAEIRARNKDGLKKRIVFTRARGLVGRIMAKMSPVKNTDVATLADNENSRIIAIGEVMPGDMIIMIQETTDDERNHILVVHEVERVDSKPTVIHYSHAIAYPEDGLYGSGMKQGTIEIADPTGSLFQQLWKEGGMIESASNIFTRARGSRTELRRLKWLYS